MAVLEKELGSACLHKSCIKLIPMGLLMEMFYSREQTLPLRATGNTFFLSGDTNSPLLLKEKWAFYSALSFILSLAHSVILTRSHNKPRENGFISAVHGW